MMIFEKEELDKLTAKEMLWQMIGYYESSSLYRDSVDPEIVAKNLEILNQKIKRQKK